MKIYNSIYGLPKLRVGSVFTVGVFDGVHLGHSRILKTLTARARLSGRKSVVLTFYPHPMSMLEPGRPVPLLISLQHRLRLLEESGVDAAILIRFDRRFSVIKPEVFIRDLLVGRLGMAEIVIGEDFVFGKKGIGDAVLLEELADKYGYAVRKVSLLKKSDKTISSTHIRQLITKGRLKEAKRLLGRPVSILGTVKKGSRRGRILGFPTANIDPHHEAIPPSGVYVVRVILDGRRYRGILNIGFRPTFHKGSGPYPPEPVIEVHIIDFRRDIYGKDLEVIFVKRLRDEKRFADSESLRSRIKLDVNAARRILASKRNR